VRRQREGRGERGEGKGEERGERGREEGRGDTSSLGVVVVLVKDVV